MNAIYLWIVTAVTAAVATSTIVRLWSDRHRLWQDDLHDEDRLFAWRIVLFLIYPLLTLVDLRSTLVACEAMGGYVSTWSYGLFWYSAVPQGLSSEQLLIALFAGAAVQAILALMLVPALFFRPHPFLATIIGYSVVGILGLNLFIDPLLSGVGMGGSRWHVALTMANPTEKMVLFSIYGVLAALYFLVLANRRTRVWFAQLSRPLVAEQLTDAQLQWRVDPQNAVTNARLAILYDRAGMRRQALRQAKELQELYPQSIYNAFVQGMLAYRQRKYTLSRQHFMFASECTNNDPPLKGSFLAAAGCAAFAEGDMEGALNLSERALEFDDASLVARMVKVDVFLRTDRKEQAGEEIISALRRGLDMDLESKVPVDTEYVLHRIGRMQVVERNRRAVASRS